MDSDKIIEKILSDARGQAEKIKAKSDGEVAEAQSELASQLDEYKKQTGVLSQKAAAEKKSRLLAAVRMEIAQECLVEKRNILDDVFDQARAQFKQLPDEEYQKIMTRLMLETVESGNEEVIVDENETRIDNKFIKDVNRKLAPRCNGNLKLSDEKQNLGAGFMLRRGKIKYNVSLKVLLEQARKGLEIELAKILYKN